MLIFLDNLMDTHTLDSVIEALRDEDLFEDGKKTAGKTAKRVKFNLQAKTDAIEVKGALKIIEKALLAHPVFQAAAIPEKLVKIMFSRYVPGMQYGSHVDEPFIAGSRTDLSFTLFLSDPDSYQGGELVLQKHAGDEAFKPPKGSLILYPSTSRHYVAEVTQGTRLAAVGWVQSRVRLAEHRELIFDLQDALTKLPDNEANREARLSLLKVKSNIVRLWAN